jgi:hypothetical protein
MVLSDGQKRLELVEAYSPYCVIGKQPLSERRMSKGDEGNNRVEAAQSSFRMKAPEMQVCPVD